MEPGCKFFCASMLRLRSTFLRMCSRLSLACPDQTVSPSTAISAQLSVIMFGRKAAAWSSLSSFHLHKHPWAQTVGHYEGWLVKGPIDLQGTGGKSHMDSGSREGRLKEWQACVCVCVCVSLGVHLEVRRSTRTPPKHPPISSDGSAGAQQAWHLSASLACVFCSQSKQVMAS